MNTNDIPKSKLEKALNILVGLSICVAISAFLVAIENFILRHNYMGNVLMTVSAWSIFLCTLIYFIKFSLGSYLRKLGFKVNCKRGLHFGKSSKVESDRYAQLYGKCFFCKKTLTIKNYKIEFNGSDYFLEASDMIEAIRKLQEQQSKTAKSFGSIFTITDLSAIGTRITTYIVKENGSLDIKK
ncbi:hypothetical protein [Acinetobacter nosocomialis]|uniref:hypothetical protein n=1 Tax=Acinetobacter nosocomialis TaxID=106654 RepID=UPI001F2FEE6F|nr:hypothetical protein [Acinetobacter nosocomialis]MCE7534226.1 hypothetical protein [Acinetobacter nosocomialis]